MAMLNNQMVLMSHHLEDFGGRSTLVLSPVFVGDEVSTPQKSDLRGGFQSKSCTKTR